jgi:hypothetical protein
MVIHTYTTENDCGRTTKDIVSTHQNHMARCHVVLIRTNLSLLFTYHACGGTLSGASERDCQIFDALRVQKLQRTIARGGGGE